MTYGLGENNNVFLFQSTCDMLLQSTHYFFFMFTVKLVI
jgi:hypothetical protein